MYDCPCVAPDIATTGRHLLVLDYQFCQRRLENAGGVLNNFQIGSGAWVSEWSNEPKIDLTNVTAAANAAFGQLVIQGSDLRLRKLTGPATALKFLRTDAAGNLIFSDPPVASIPASLTPTNISVSNLATLNNVEIGGSVLLTAIAAGTVVNGGFLGLDATNNLVKAAPGIEAAMFFESPVSPPTTWPNQAVAPGAYLVIGNTMYDSGASLIAVTNSTTLTVSVAGKYVLLWQATNYSTSLRHPGAWLEINGIIVSNGGADDPQVPALTPNQNSSGQRQFTGLEARSLAAGDIIRLMSNPNSPGPTNPTSQVRLVAVKFKT